MLDKMHLLILGAVIPPVFSLCLYPWWWLFDNTKVLIVILEELSFKEI